MGAPNEQSTPSSPLPLKASSPSNPLKPATTTRIPRRFQAVLLLGILTFLTLIVLNTICKFEVKDRNAQHTGAKTTGKSYFGLWGSSKTSPSGSDDKVPIWSLSLLSSHPFAHDQDLTFKWKCSSTDREQIDSGQAHRFCNPRTKVTVNWVNPCIPELSAPKKTAEGDKQDSIQNRNWGAQECTGNQTVYDRWNMEHLDFTDSSLQDTCSHLDPTTRPPAKIPKIVHFIFGLQNDFGGHPFLFAHFMAIKMARDTITPEVLYIHYFYEPTGHWWEKTKALNLVQINKIKKIPDEVFGNRVDDYAHKADVLRLHVLMKYGGIYLDSDVFIYRSLDPLLHHEFVMAKEDFHGMANAFILAHSESKFLRSWYGRYKDFDDKVWSEHSVFLPLRMLGEMPETVCALPRVSVFYPSFHNDHVDFVHSEDEYIFANSYQYGYHAFNHVAFRYLKSVTPDHVRNVNTSFTRLLRPFLDDTIVGNDSGYTEKS
ncbi:hypothetical protein HDU76_002043 [Blyttiomyces sp. JEL0837]|nr:hypothetical protein HDU76_002043 [Blyttiomyces sp. JEL0837]